MRTDYAVFVDPYARTRKRVPFDPGMTRARDWLVPRPQLLSNLADAAYDVTTPLRWVVDRYRRVPFFGQMTRAQDARFFRDDDPLVFVRAFDSGVRRDDTWTVAYEEHPVSEGMLRYAHDRPAALFKWLMTCGAVHVPLWWHILPYDDAQRCYRALIRGLRLQDPRA